MTRQYAVLLTRDPELGGWWVLVPLLPGCYSKGDTKAEALEHVREAIAGHLAALEANGELVPSGDVEHELHTVQV